jgi:hypothetical protein
MRKINNASPSRRSMARLVSRKKSVSETKENVERAKMGNGQSTATAPHEKKEPAKRRKEDETRSEMLVKREFSAERMLAKKKKARSELNTHEHDDDGEAMSSLLTEKFHV